MPLRYKIPGYFGNGALLILCLVMLASGSAAIGFALGALSAFNLFMVYKLDQFSKEEAWLAYQIKVTGMKEDLLVRQAHVTELEADVSVLPPGNP